ncbi:MAG: membrane dipeptidase [Clostridia bacterium]|nr:membrane dipeptidase [Clostridia bacterium]
MIPLFDLHCDTLYEMYKHNESIFDNNLHISLKKAEKFSPYIQICAIWSDFSLSDEDAFQNYLKVIDYARLNFTTKARNLKNHAYILSIEDARILNGDLSRLDRLYNDGVRFLTFNWKGKSIIGGAWDTSLPLTDFGKNTLYRCLELGIIPDISHSSTVCSEEIIDICEEKNKVAIASHSNSLSVCNHKRNLSDELFCRLVKLKSVVGISLASEHLTTDRTATIDEILKHIYHYLSLGGEDVICLGCDFDGVSSLPLEINSIKDLDKLYFEIEKGFGNELAKKIFFKNAYEFMCRNLK